MRVAVLGTMVWDRIDHPDRPTVERWGGIAYSLAAAAAVAPEGTRIRPVIRIGRDLREQALAFLETLPLEAGPGIAVVDEPSNRVHLRYDDRHHRRERLTGGVGPWPLGELETALADVDAVYVNLISGFELTVDAASALRRIVDGPAYGDLHSLLLGVGPAGVREPAPLRDRDAWLAAFDVVQVNEAELTLVAGSEDPDRVARDHAGRGGVILVTMGPGGARWYAPGDTPRPWAARRGSGASGRIGHQDPAAVGDPTGCGDVWGATCFLRLVEGASLSEAMTAANGVARHNVNHQGADGLYEYLRSIP